MSELKAYYVPTRSGNSCHCYIKSEVDKVIAELKKACNSKDDWCLHTLKENRHQKYKRCLKNREICVMRFDIELARQHPTRTVFWSKWERKWLELAENFKPNNSTAK